MVRLSSKGILSALMTDLPSSIHGLKQTLIYTGSQFSLIAVRTCFHHAAFTPHAQCEQGKVIGVGVHIYICGQKN